MQAAVKDLKQVIEKIVTGTDERAKERHTKRGKLLVRDRIEGLLDAGSSFLELSQLAGFEMYGKEEVTFKLFPIYIYLGVGWRFGHWRWKCFWSSMHDCWQ